MRRPVVLLAILSATGGCGTASVGDRPDLPDAAEDEDRPDATQADAAPPPDAIPCDGGDARVVDPMTGACYIYVATTRSWSAAQMNCVTLGGDLAVATSMREIGLLAALPLTPQTLPDSWIGGTDAVTEGTWLWVTAEAMTYTNWRAGEPNNGGGAGQEDCMALEADNAGTWDDRPCAVGYPSLCEIN